ncbi:MAG: putative glycoside hydrolase [Candidatus Paceibacterota bacterium]
MLRKIIGRIVFGGAVITGLALLIYGFYFYIPPYFTSQYTNFHGSILDRISFGEDLPAQVPFIVTHQKTPEAVRAIYMTQCVVGTVSFRERLVSLIEETELNAVVIDIKDYTGKIAFKSEHPLLKEFVSDTCGAYDMKEFIGTLHKKNIYVIGRITVFQDPYYAKKYPEQAIQKESDKSVWEDYKGLSFIDPSAQEAWRYIVALSHEAYKIGFDELNYDYIRFPSDGNMKDIYFPLSEEQINADPNFGKADILRNFFKYLKREMEETDAVLSADLFGMTMTTPNDLNIGQILEYAEPYFDYIAPMVYPSHFPKDFNGWADPNQHVYDVIKYSMSKGVDKMLAASSTPLKLRPWLQDFNYGGYYGADEVRAQIQAVYDTGLTSWMLWSPSNVYTKDALLAK